MADPLSIGLMIAGTAVSAIGAVRQGQAQAAAANYNARIADQNAQIAQSQGVAAAEQQQRDAQRKIGAAIATYGASGVDLSTGSPSDVLADSARSSALDNLTIKYNANLRAQGFQQQAALDRANAANSKTAGYLSATSQLLTGGAKAFGSMDFGTGGVNTTGATGTGYKIDTAYENVG